MALAGFFPAKINKRKRKASADFQTNEADLSDYPVLTPSKKQKMAPKKSNLLSRSFSKARTLARNLKTNKQKKVKEIKQTELIKSAQKNIEKCKNGAEARNKFLALLQSYLPKQIQRQKKPEKKFENKNDDQIQETLKIANELIKEDNSWIMVPSASPKKEDQPSISMLSPIKSAENTLEIIEDDEKLEPSLVSTHIDAKKETFGEQFLNDEYGQHAENYEGYDHYDENYDPNHYTDEQLVQFYGSSQGKYVHHSDSESDQFAQRFQNENQHQQSAITISDDDDENPLPPQRGRSRSRSKSYSSSRSYSDSRSRTPDSGTSRSYYSTTEQPSKIEAAEAKLRAVQAENEHDALARFQKLDFIQRDIKKDKHLQPKLTSDEEEEATDILENTPSHKIIANKFKLEITGRSIRTLHRLNWLDDEIINFYMEMINQRSTEKGHYPVWATNTFFFTTLSEQGYMKVRRWTKRKKIDVFECQYMIVPVHLGAHWTSCVIDFTKRTIRFYDSMSTTNGTRFCKTLLEYLDSEHKDKKSCPLPSKDDWKMIGESECPQQENGSDCGVFTICIAENISRSHIVAQTQGWNFKQLNMPMIRKKVALEIVNGRLFD